MPITFPDYEIIGVKNIRQTSCFHEAFMLARCDKVVQKTRDEANYIVLELKTELWERMIRVGAHLSVCH